MNSRFAAPLEQAGYTVTQDTKARYLRGMLISSNCFQGASFESFRFLRYEYILRLFTHAALRKGNAYTTKELRQMANPAEDTLPFLNTFYNLVICALFHRGYRLECNQCGLEWWYPLRELTHEPLKCEGCQHTLFLPLELDFAYRLNPLLAVGINNGALTIFLAALALKPEEREFSYDFCAVVRKGTLITDIDLLLWKDGRLCLVECKDNLPEENALREQLTKLATIAHDTDADAYFATLADIVPENILTFAAEHKIAVLTRRELLK